MKKKRAMTLTTKITAYFEGGWDWRVNTLYIKLRSFAKKKVTKKALTKSRTRVATLSKSRSILLISSDLLSSTESDPFMETPACY